MERHKTEEIYLPDEIPLKVLVVENNKTVAKLVTTVLQKSMSPCTVDVSNDSYESLSILEKNKYDIILLDSTMEMEMEDWIESVRAVKIMYPILVMALSEVTISTEIILGTGAEGIIYKPVQPKELILGICEILDIDIEERGYSSNFYKTIKIDKK